MDMLTSECTFLLYIILFLNVHNKPFSLFCEVNTDLLMRNFPQILYRIYVKYIKDVMNFHRKIKLIQW